MFEPEPTPRRRPMFAVSAAAHAALALALVVPPLLATPEPLGPDGIVRIEWFPVHMNDAPVRPRKNVPRNVSEGRPAARAANERDAGARPPLSQSTDIGSVLPEPTGADDNSFAFEETGERSEPRGGIPGGPGGPGHGSGEPGCEGCNVISAEAPGVTPPVALESAPLAYPELARRARVEGVVVLEAIISADGLVRDVRVLRGANPLLDPTAVEAVRRWRYRPARIGERPIAVSLKVVVTFSLRNL
jgi:protein TonB